MNDNYHYSEISENRNEDVARWLNNWITQGSTYHRLHVTRLLELIVEKGFYNFEITFDFILKCYKFKLTPENIQFSSELQHAIYNSIVYEIDNPSR